MADLVGEEAGAARGDVNSKQQGAALQPYTPEITLSHTGPPIYEFFAVQSQEHRA